MLLVVNINGRTRLKSFSKIFQFMQATDGPSNTSSSPMSIFRVTHIIKSLLSTLNSYASIRHQGHQSFNHSPCCMSGSGIEIGERQELSNKLYDITSKVESILFIPLRTTFNSARHRIEEQAQLTTNNRS